jgi:hypothetical protein
LDYSVKTNKKNENNEGRNKMAKTAIEGCATFDGGEYGNLELKFSSDDHQLIVVANNSVYFFADHFNDELVVAKESDRFSLFAFSNATVYAGNFILDIKCEEGLVRVTDINNNLVFALVKGPSGRWLLDARNG